jgi:hypothetical protein
MALSKMDEGAEEIRAGFEVGFAHEHIIQAAYCLDLNIVVAIDTTTDDKVNAAVVNLGRIHV